MSSFFARNKIESVIAKSIFAILSFCNESLGFLLFYEDERDSRHQNFIFKLETFDVRFCTTPCMTWNIRASPSLVTFHQTNRLHDGLQPWDSHFTNQINILSKTSAKKNILNAQANQLLQAKKQLFLFLIILQLHIFFLKVSCWDGNWTFSHGRVSGFVFLFFPDLNYTERGFESRFEELPCSLFPGSR